MKKSLLKRTVALLAITMGLSACGSDYPQLSEEETRLVGEYAAMLLLKYDANQRSRLVDISAVDEADRLAAEKALEEQAASDKQQEQDDQTSGMKPTDDTTVIDKTQDDKRDDIGSVAELAQLLELQEGITFSYEGSYVTDSYSESEEMDGYFALQAPEGKALLVLEFEMKNESSNAQSADVLSKRIAFRVKVNDNYTRTALVTMLMNDLSTYAGTIAAGESQNLVLIVEVDETMASNIESIQLSLKNDSNSYTILLQ